MTNSETGRRDASTRPRAHLLTITEINDRKRQHLTNSETGKEEKRRPLAPVYPREKRRDSEQRPLDLPKEEGGDSAQRPLGLPKEEISTLRRGL